MHDDGVQRWAWVPLSRGRQLRRAAAGSEPYRTRCAFRGGAVKSESFHTEDVDRAAAGNGDPLFSIGEKRQGPASDGAACLKLPQGFAGCGVERVDVAFVRAAKHQTACRRHDARPRWTGQFEIPDALA